MESKFYVSLKAEELLKEKGCPINCRITKAEAIDWLESKGIHIELRTMYCEYKQEYGWHWFYAICKGDCIEKISERNDCIKLFPTRLEAEEAAIIKALELL